ncbi:MAG TPA: hypothetical protein VGJ54_16710 [Streptosporangiaceae bacterium]
MIATASPLTAARAAALFVSDLSATEQPTALLVEATIKHALRTHGGTGGCAADVAAAYGDYPELAAPRMRWARSLVEDLYERRMRQRPRHATRLTASARHQTRPQVLLAGAA